MRYAVARFKTQIRESAYRNYVTDALYCVVSGGHYTLTRRYSEIFEPEKPKVEDNRTQEEIVAAVWAGITGEKAVTK